jgi:hypothetical protein
MPETTAKPPKRPAKPKTTTSQGVDTPEATKSNAGAPTTYTEEMAELICNRISSGESLKSITNEPDMPCQTAVYAWLLRDPEFAKRYARAREEQADTLADEIVDIADERPEVNELIDKKTGEVLSIDLSSSYIAWQKNRIEARKWTAMKLRPKKYGDKLELGGNPDNPLKFEVKIEAEQNLAELVKHAELKRQAANAE